MTGTWIHRLTRFTAAVALAGLVACEATAPSLVPVSLYLTGGPDDGEAVTSEQVKSAQVWISSAYLVPAGEDGAFYPFFETGEGEEPREFDLLQLQGHVNALLEDANIAEGDYEQLRLVVDRARITLNDGTTFEDGESSKDLFVPSGMETGIKVEFGGPITINGTTTLTVTFDVDANFTFLGPPTQPFDVLFTPLLVGSVTGG